MDSHSQEGAASAGTQPRAASAPDKTHFSFLQTHLPGRASVSLVTALSVQRPGSRQEMSQTGQGCGCRRKREMLATRGGRLDFWGKVAVKRLLSNKLTWGMQG